MSLEMYQVTMTMMIMAETEVVTVGVEGVMETGVRKEEQAVVAGAEAVAAPIEVGVLDPRAGANSHQRMRVRVTFHTTNHGQ
jgi:hypothetical protein